MFGDHTAIISGNGQLIGPAATLQPPDEINDVPGSNGCYRPFASPATRPNRRQENRPCTR
ncbi:hypothetical protein I552_0487 [Mycobacterium xenopi 3993]|nr:hypothetical protein I552_0487 [Mycobacterium xenopi 3993]